MMQDRFLIAVIVVTVALFVLALLLFALTFALHFRTDNRGRRWKELEARWEEALLAFLAGESPADRFHDLVEPGSELFLLQYLLGYHRTLAGAERTRVEALARPYLPRVEDRLSSRHPEVRARAVITLCALGPSRYEEEILAALDDPCDLVAAQAAGALARAGRIHALPRILSRLGRFQGWSSAYMVSLVASMGQEAAPILGRIFASRGHPPEVRAFAALALAELGALDVAAPAARACAEEEDAGLLEAALTLLGRTGGPEHAAAALPLARSTVPRVRRRALRALAELGAEAVP